MIMKYIIRNISNSSIQIGAKILRPVTRGTKSIRLKNTDTLVVGASALRTYEVLTHFIGGRIAVYEKPYGVRVPGFLPLDRVVPARLTTSRILSPVEIDLDADDPEPDPDPEVPDPDPEEPDPDPEPEPDPEPDPDPDEGDPDPDPDPEGDGGEDEGGEPAGRPAPPEETIDDIDWEAELTEENSMERLRALGALFDPPVNGQSKAKIIEGIIDRL